jgi:riboflavin biosynthesis pyrimidine reductase
MTNKHKGVTVKKMELMRVAAVMAAFVGTSTAYADDNGENVTYIGAGATEIPLKVVLNLVR